MWRENRRRRNETFSFWDVLHTFGPDYKVIVVGDAYMSPHEITMRGGSVEHYNDEPGTNLLSRLLQHYQKTVWLNPLPSDEWKYGQSIQMTNRLMEGRMYPLNLEGLDQAIGMLSGKHSV